MTTLSIRHANRTPTRTGSIAVLYENAEWTLPWLDAMDDRDLDYRAIDLADGAYRLDAPVDHELVINRVSPSAALRGNGSAIPLVRGWLDQLERAGTRMINGAASFRLETSKVAQYQLIGGLGLPLPATAVFNSARSILEQLDGFPFPAILKPETGGSGAGVRFVPNLVALRELLAEGLDDVMLLQQYVSSEDGSIMRTEFIDGELVYAMRARPDNTFNLCPAEGCERPAADPGADGEPDVTFEHVPELPADALTEARAILRAAKLDVGGVEYIETPDGTRYFYDINATSVYRRDIAEAAGVDPEARLMRFIEREALSYVP